MWLHDMLTVQPELSFTFVRANVFLKGYYYDLYKYNGCVNYLTHHLMCKRYNSFEGDVKKENAWLRKKYWH